MHTGEKQNTLSEHQTSQIPEEIANQLKDTITGLLLSHMQSATISVYRREDSEIQRQLLEFKAENTRRQGRQVGMSKEQGKSKLRKGRQVGTGKE